MGCDHDLRGSGVIVNLTSCVPLVLAHAYVWVRFATSVGTCNTVRHR